MRRNCLRAENANESFRRSIDTHLSALHAAPLDDLERVAAEVARALASLFAEHQQTVGRISEVYARKHSVTAIPTVVIAAAWLIPTLAPFRDSGIGAVAPLAVAGNFLRDKREERAERKTAARSLAGVLAAENSPKQGMFDWLSSL